MIDVGREGYNAKLVERLVLSYSGRNACERLFSRDVKFHDTRRRASQVH